MGRVARAERQVQHEGLVRLHVAQVGDELDRPIGQIGAEVVAVGRRAGRRDPVVVVGEGRLELVGLAAEEAVEALEAAPERPRRPRRPEVEVLVGREVPLAHGVGRVAVRNGELGEHPGRSGDPAVVAGEPGCQVGDPADADAVVVAAGQQAGAGRRAQRRGVEVAVAKAAGGERVDGRRLDVRSVAAELREPHVVEHDGHEVRRALRGSRRFGPARLGVGPVAGDGAAELGPVAHQVEAAAGSAAEANSQNWSSHIIGSR